MQTVVELLDAADAEDRQRRAAGALAARGCRWGDRVAFALGSSADLICAVLGAARTGLIPVLLNATLTPAERDLLADDAQPVLRIFDPVELARLAEGAPVDLAPYPLTRPMHYTSGTTGRPKGVTTGIWDEATARPVFEDEAAVWHFQPADLHMVCSPMYHTVSIRFSTGTLLSGGSLAILSRFDAATALDVIRRHRPTTTFLVPTHLQRILQSPELGPGETFDSLRLLVHAGAPCPESVKRATMDRVRAGAVWEFYGSTEAQFTVCPPDDWLERPGTVGRARTGRRLFVEPDSGVIWCDMPDFARFSYWRNDEATQQAWRGPACTIGDLGRLDPDGFLYLTGRRHDLIISGGVNVYPAEIENVLAAVDGVAEVAVFGLPDEQWGQRVCVAYVREARSSRRPPRRPCGPPRRIASPRTSGPRPTSRPGTCPTPPPGSSYDRAVPDHLGLAAAG